MASISKAGMHHQVLHVERPRPRRLSSGFGDLNTWEWVPGKPTGNYWHLSIFGNEYKVKRLGGHRNLIKPFNRSRSPSGIPYVQKGKRKAKGIKSTPVIDGLKLWSILVDDGRTGLSRDLKSIAERELGIKTIPWSREAGETLSIAYRMLISLNQYSTYSFRKSQISVI